MHISREARYSGILKYETADSYPARRTLTELSRRFAEAGWVTSDEDLFNPPDKPSARRTWTLVRVNGQTSYTWTGGWKDAAGDMVLINLQNEVESVDQSPPGSPMKFSGSVKFEAIRFSASMADTIRRAFKNRQR